MDNNLNRIKVNRNYSIQKTTELRPTLARLETDLHDSKDDRAIRTRLKKWYQYERDVNRRKYKTTGRRFVYLLSVIFRRYMIPYNTDAYRGM